jgi:predicted deacylase
MADPMSGTMPAESSPLLPHFEVALVPPDLTPWLEGNTGILGFTRLESGRTGPDVTIVSLMHGNELAGAIVLDAMLRNPPRLASGRLTLGFANIEAFHRFNPKQPTASRFVDEDLNRLWDPHMLDGPRHSSELTRARQMRPLIERTDLLLDLHSMLWPSDPLILSGPSMKGRELARSIGTPDLVISDHGHVSGPRLIDYSTFTGPSAAAAVLVEAGQHWEAATVSATQACVDGLLHATGLVPGRPMAHRPRLAEVTIAVTAGSASFTFVQAFRGGDIIPTRNTLIAMDGPTEIRTPHDDCLLVMPSLRPSRGHTAVRLARLL